MRSSAEQRHRRRMTCEQMQAASASVRARMHRHPGLMSLVGALLLVGCGPDEFCPSGMACIPLEDREQVDCSQPTTPPMANAGADFEVSPGWKATLNASASAVGAARIPRFHWTLTRVPEGSESFLYSKVALNPGFTTDRPGQYEAALIVHDGCTYSEPDHVTVLARNQPPTSDAGSDQRVQRNTSVLLDGRGSRDPDGDAVQFAWSLVTAPAGSTARLHGADTAQATFLADRAGTYVIELQARDAERAGAPDRTTIVSENQAPTVDTLPGPLLAECDAPLTIRGVADDPDGDALEISWALIERPDGSVATVAEPGSLTSSFTPDLEGSYRLELRVFDGIDIRTATLLITAWPARPRLLHRVTDAAYSRALDRLVMVDEAQSRLYVLDPETQVETSIELPLRPTSVDLSPDGLTAVVGHVAFVSHVDLVGRTVLRAWPLDIDVFDVVVAGNGYAHAFPLENEFQSPGLRSIRLVDGTQTRSTGGFVAGKSRGRLLPGSNRMYVSASSFLRRFDLSAGTAHLESETFNGKSSCGDFWPDELGARVFTGCGTAYRTSDLASEDLTYAGYFPGVAHIRHLDHSLGAQRIALVMDASKAEDTEASTRIWLHDSEYLASQSSIDLPQAAAHGRSHLLHGRYVFHSADGSRLHVIAQAAKEYGLPLDFFVLSY